MKRVFDLLRAHIVELADEVEFNFIKRLGRFIDRITGRMVPESRVEETASRITDELGQRVERITQRFIDGDISVDKWQAQMRQELKDGYLTNAMLGRGGKNAMTQADYGRMGGKLNFEYRKLDDFARAIKTDNLTPAQIQARAHLYANGATQAYYDGLTVLKKDAGFVEERRVLDPAAHNCDDCISYAGRGWVPIGTLPSPGAECRCHHNCKCRKEYRRRGEE